MLHDESDGVEELFDTVEVMAQDLVEFGRRDLRIEIG